MKVDAAAVLNALGIQATRKGKMHWASCPSPGHRDSDASWRIFLDEEDERYGQHRCYGCGFGGYAVHLVQEVMGVERADAREWLKTFAQAERLPLTMELVQTGPTLGREFTLPYGVHQIADRPLAEWPRVVKRYCYRRGITPQQIERWDIGYAVEGYLRGRVVLPVRDARGVLVSYTGRTFTGAELRYKNGRESEGADLAAIFGEEWWDEQQERVILTEGGINGLACERAAPGWSIAALFGSQLHPKHLLKLSRFKRVVLASDPDPAGEKVANQLAEQLARYADVTRLPLRVGTDCADIPEDELRGMLLAERP